MVIPSKIIRSNRRSISLSINDKAELIVRAPIRCSDKKIYDFIVAKESWIVSKQALMRQSANEHKCIEVQSGEVIHILSTPYTLVIGECERTTLRGDKIYLPTKDSKTKLIHLLMRLAKQYISLRVEHYARMMGVQYKNIKINQAHTRWGSCSGEDGLNFCFRLILCTPEVLDYIVVHELCHIREKNHSRRFWALVESILPNYREQERWLKTNRHIMKII